MLPFIILLTFPIAISPFIKKVKINGHRLEQLSLFVFFVILTFLVMFRHRYIGNDTSNYMNFFESIRYTDFSLTEKSSLEVGFRLYMKFISLFTNDPHVFIAVSGFVVSAMIYLTYRRLCVDPALTIVLFCNMSTFLMMFSGIRQMMAVGLGVIAYEFTRRKMLIPFFITVVAAFFIHTSSFMLILMYPVFYLRITRKWLFAVIPVMLVIFIFNKQIFNVLGKFLEQYTNYDVEIVSTGAYTMLFLFAIFAVFSFVIPDESLLDDETIGMRNFLLLSLVIQMFAPLNFLAMRMNYYYTIFIPLLLPRIIQYSRPRFRQVALVSRYVMLVFFTVYFFMSISGGSKMHIVPYHFFWENYL